VEIGRQVRLLCPWARHLTELPLSLSGKTGSKQSEKFSKSSDWLEKSRPSKKATFVLMM